MSEPRQLRLGAFRRPVSIHTGAWRYPGGYPDANFNFGHIKQFAQTLERGRFDGFFMADHLSVPLEMPVEGPAQESGVAQDDHPPPILYVSHFNDSHFADEICSRGCETNRWSTTD